MAIDFKALRTTKQLSEANPAFSESSIRWLIFNAGMNGLDQAIVRVGRRVLIDEARFNDWLNNQRAAA